MRDDGIGICNHLKLVQGTQTWLQPYSPTQGLAGLATRRYGFYIVDFISKVGPRMLLILKGKHVCLNGIVI